jgi:hypothetical protein
MASNNTRQMPPSCWIWNQKQETDNGIPKLIYFRKTLILDKKPENAVIKVSADSRYRLYVNGRSVAFGPCKGDNQIWYFDEVDIAPYLKQGENALAAVVLRYSTLHDGNYSIWRTSMPGFYLSGIINSGEESVVLCADESWMCKAADHIKIVPEERFRYYLYNLENAEGDRRFKDWLFPGYDDSSWEKAAVYQYIRISRASSPGNLLPRPIPFLYEKEQHFKGIMCIRQSVYGKEKWDAFIDRADLEIPANSVEIVELDAGELTTGFLHLVCSGGKGSHIKILVSESYAYETDDPSPYAVPRKSNRTDWEKGKLYGNIDTYKPGGYGKSDSPEEYEPFWWKTFRFVQLHITTDDEPLVLHDFYYRETGYPLEVKTQVETSDPELQAIWDISLRTLRRCMHETYEDCPFYEQLQYAMDARLQILYTYNVSADDRLARRCIDDFHRSLRYDGLTNASYPRVNTNVIPGFSLYYIMMIHDHMMYFGDRTLVERYMPTVDAILSFFERNRDSRGLAGKAGFFPPGIWSFIDWTPEWMGGVPTAIHQGPITMESLLYAYTLNFAAELADYIGRKESAAIYRERGDSMKAAINKYCLGKNGLYQDGPGVDQYSQHCQVFAVLSETVAAANWRPLMEKCLEGETGGEPLAKCSVAMAFYLFRAVEKAGLYDRTSPLWDPWRKMLKNNLTTCEEDQVTARSDCHAWASLALYELPAVILGVRPASPGYGSIAVNPVPGFLQWAKGSVITPKGIVHVGWEKSAEGIRLDVKAPEGIAVKEAT